MATDLGSLIGPAKAEKWQAETATPLGEAREVVERLYRRAKDEQIKASVAADDACARLARVERELRLIAAAADALVDVEVDEAF